MTILKNSAKCNNCGDVLISEHRHDYMTCKCYNITRNRVSDVARRLEEEEGIEEYYNHEDYKVAVKEMTGIMIDGGKEYLRRGWGRKEDFIDLSEVVED